MLFTATDPPNWNRTLVAAQKAKDQGVVIGVMTRGEDRVSGENFRKLSSERLAWFGEEKEQLKALDELIDTGFLCKVMKTAVMVSNM